MVAAFVSLPLPHRRARAASLSARPPWYRSLHASTAPTNPLQPDPPPPFLPSPPASSDQPPPPPSPQPSASATTSAASSAASAAITAVTASTSSSSYSCAAPPRRRQHFRSSYHSTTLTSSSASSSSSANSSSASPAPSPLLSSSGRPNYYNYNYHHHHHNNYHNNNNSNSNNIIVATHENGERHAVPPPNWPALSRAARNLLAALPPPTSARPRHTALARLLRSHPSNPFLWHALAAHHVSANNLAAAHAVLASARRALPPGTCGALHHLAASLHVRSRDRPAAIDLLQVAIRSDPYAPLFLLLARLHLNAAPQKKQSSSSLAASSLSGSSSPSSSPALSPASSPAKQNAQSPPLSNPSANPSANTAAASGLDEARKVLREGLAIFPRSTALWREYAHLEANYAGRTATALAVTRDALDHVPACAPLWQLLARLEAATGAGPARLADVLYDALAACPQDPPLRLRLARIEAKRKGPHVAREVLAPVMAGPFPDVARFLATLHFDDGELAQARQLFRRAADLEATRVSKLNGKNDHNKQRNNAATGHDINPCDTDNDHDFYNSSQSNDDDDQDDVDDNDKYSNRVNSSSPSKRGTAKHRRPAAANGVKTLHAWALLEARVGNVDEARSLLAEARALCQTDPALWRALAELEARERNYDEARRAFQNALALDPDDPRVYLAWSRTEALAGDEKRAEALIAKIDTLPPNRRRAVLSRGDRAASRGRRRGSVAVLFNTDEKDGVRTRAQNDSTRSDDDGSDGEEGGVGGDNGDGGVADGHTRSLTPHVLCAALRERAMMATRDGRFEDAVTLLRRASKVEPQSETVWRLLAAQEKRLKGMERLREVYDMGLEQVAQRSKPLLLHWWGQDERAEGNVDKARNLFRRATVANPQYMSAWMSWGLLEKGEGRVEKACEIFEKATRRAEKDAVRAPFVFLAWGRLEEIERGQGDVAASIFKRGVRVAPSCGALWTAWGLLEQRRGNVGKARELLNKATEVDGKHAAAWHSLALLEARVCNFGKAETLFRTGNGCDSKDASLLTSWARMEGNELGDVTRARDLFERAVEADAKYWPAYVAWGEAEIEAGNINLGRDVLERATRIRDCGAGAWVALARIAAEKDHDMMRAVRLLRVARDTAPADAAGAQQWALLEVKRGYADRARAIVQDALAQCQSTHERAAMLGVRARVELAAEAAESAQASAHDAVQIAPRVIAAWEAAIDVAKAVDGVDAAARVAREGTKALEGSMDLAVMLARRAGLEAEAGRMHKARTLFSDALRSHPARGQTWRDLIDAERQYGDASRAERVEKRFERAFNRRLDRTDLGLNDLEGDADATD